VNYRALTFVVILTAVAALLAGCCQSFTETGTGTFPCETCPDLPIDLHCTGNAKSVAAQDATAKAKAKCGTNTLQVGEFTVDKAECIKQAGQWVVQVTGTGQFKCCK
jgi:hypothetical protein